MGEQVSNDFVFLTNTNTNRNSKSNLQFDNNALTQNFNDAKNNFDDAKTSLTMQKPRRA